MSIDTYIEIIPNEQLIQLESNPELIEALEQLACSPSLYEFYRLKDGDDDEKEEYFEIIEEFDVELVNEIEAILKNAEYDLSKASLNHLSSGFESTYDLHKQALPKALTQQNINDASKITETLLSAEEWLASDSIRILPHDKCIELNNILKDIDINGLQPFYYWHNHEPIEEWQQQVFDDIASLLKIIRAAATHNASLLYIYS